MAASFSRHPFLLTAQEVAEELHTDTHKGLTEAQVRELQEKYPKNELDVGGAIPWYKILTKQLFNAMIIVSDLLHMLFVANRSGTRQCHGRLLCLSRLG